MTGLVIGQQRAICEDYISHKGKDLKQKEAVIWNTKGEVFSFIITVLMWQSVKLRFKSLLSNLGHVRSMLKKQTNNKK